MIDGLSGMLTQQLKAHAPMNLNVADMEQLGKTNDPTKTDFSSVFSSPSIQGPQKVNGPSDDFGSMVTNMVNSVDAKGKAAKTELNRMMLGESDNIHQSMIAMQESGLAFTMLVEVRNKLVSSFQELMKMPV